MLLRSNLTLIYASVSQSYFNVVVSALSAAAPALVIRLYHTPNFWPAGISAGARPPAYVVGAENVTEAGAVSSLAIAVSVALRPAAANPICQFVSALVESIAM